MIARLDPRGCGCTDCILGEYSKPLESATEDELILTALGRIDNATGEKIRLTTFVGEDCSGCRRVTVHHVCGKTPRA